MKCLIVQFRNAGIFAYPQYSKDKVFDLSGKYKRSEAPRMDIPAGTLSKRHISNLLHVLMGERPVPSMRKTIFEPISDIQKLSENSRVKINTALDNFGQYVTEWKTVKKSVWDSWNTSSHSIRLGDQLKELPCTLTWKKLEEYLEPELFEKFREVVKAICGKKIFQDRVDRAFERLSESKSPLIKKLIKELEEGKKTPIAHLLRGNAKESGINASGNIKVRRNVLSAVEKIAKIDGAIYIPMEDKDIQRLRNGTGIASFLEGGFAYIDRIAEYSENLVSGTAAPVK